MRPTGNNCEHTSCVSIRTLHQDTARAESARSERETVLMRACDCIDAMIAWKLSVAISLLRCAWPAYRPIGGAWKVLSKPTAWSMTADAGAIKLMLNEVVWVPKSVLITTTLGTPARRPGRAQRSPPRAQTTRGAAARGADGRRDVRPAPGLRG